MADRYGTFGSILADTLEGNRAFTKDYRATQALQALSRSPNDPTAQAGVLATSPNLYPGILNAQTAQRRQAADEAQVAASTAARANAARVLQGLPPLPMSTGAAPASMAPASPTSIAAPNPVAPSASPVGSGPAAPQASPGPGMAPAEAGDVTVVAPTKKLSPQEQLATIYAQDPDGEVTKQFMAMQSHISTLDEAGRKQLADRSEAFGSAIPALQGMPYAQRRDVIDANRGFLKSHGWTDAQIDSYDPTDQNLSASLGQALGAKGVLERGDKDRNFAETQREHNLSHADSAASRAVTMRGQNMTDSRSREANAISQSQANNPAVVDYLAQNFIASGGQMPQLGMKSGPLRAAIVARAQQMASGNGQNGTDLANASIDFGGRKAAARTIGNTSAKVDYGVNELTASIPLARRASVSVPRDQFVPFNVVQQVIQRGGGSPELRDFAVKTQSVINAYNLTAARAGSSVGEREHNTTLLSTADSPRAFNAALAAMAQEGEVAKAASHKTASEISGVGRSGPPADIQAILKKYGH